MKITLQEMNRGYVYTYDENNKEDIECMQYFERYLIREKIPYTINYTYLM